VKQTVPAVVYHKNRSQGSVGHPGDTKTAVVHVDAEGAPNGSRKSRQQKRVSLTRGRGVEIIQSRGIGLERDTEDRSSRVMEA